MDNKYVIAICERAGVAPDMPLIKQVVLFVPRFRKWPMYAPSHKFDRRVPTDEEATPKQIAAETKRIREKWSDSQEAAAVGRPTQKWSVPVVHCEDEFVRSQEIFW